MEPLVSIHLHGRKGEATLAAHVPATIAQLIELQEQGSAHPSLTLFIHHAGKIETPNDVLQATAQVEFIDELVGALQSARSLLLQLLTNAAPSDVAAKGWTQRELDRARLANFGQPLPEKTLTDELAVANPETPAHAGFHGLLNDKFVSGCPACEAGATEAEASFNRRNRDL